ncbi:MAG TPA: hypothetical protein VFL57_06325 [Bryobacteraceae bacterium]|nr:hypothetical protein [Bryobacteraceae bacterium]
MSAASIPEPLTVAEFDRIPDPPGGRLELRHGEAVFVSYPDRVRKILQRRLRQLIEEVATAAKVAGFTETESPYRPLPEHCELWSADVAFGSDARDQTPGRWLMGSLPLLGSQLPLERLFAGEAA